MGFRRWFALGFALLLGLNLPAIQVANYAAMPFQLALVAPFLKVGGRLAAFGFKPGAGPLFNLPALQIVSHLGGMAGQALLGWMLFAAPARHPDRCADAVAAANSGAGGRSGLTSLRALDWCLRPFRH